ncbi:MAG TPA: hypothetical protein PLF13_06520 [candidate division Zixibacteria bacterium]|nr:hypothetical protein [candidate division Zixibacteria bacterium]
MKINPLGIQSYQELIRRDNPAAQQQQTATETTQTTDKVAIDASDSTGSSRIAVKAEKGSYDEFLSVEERQALDLLFSRFRGHERFVTETADDSGASNSVGAWIDVKA